METKKMSKTKIGAVLIGAGIVLGTIGGYLSGTIDIMTAIQALLIEVGGIFAAFGIRDLNFINGISSKK